MVRLYGSYRPKENKKPSIREVWRVLNDLLSQKSGWQDSNLRPPGPKPGTLTGLCYTPRLNHRNDLILFVCHQACDPILESGRKCKRFSDNQTATH